MHENILTIGVATPAEVKARAKAAFRGQRDTTPRYTFTSSEDLLRTLNPNRWGLLQAMAGAGPLGVRELARRVDRDVKGVHTDATVLVECGLIDKAESGTLHFPYDGVHVEFETHAGAISCRHGRRWVPRRSEPVSHAHHGHMPHTVICRP